MNFLKNFNFDKFIGTHTLLYGETDTKKTFYTAEFIKFLLEKKEIDPKQISILDFGPKLLYLKGLKIGGRIRDYYPKSDLCNNILFEGDIIPPRLNAKNREELYQNLCYNYKRTSKALENFNKGTTSFLIINDISIYLHLGNKKYFLNTIDKTSTFFGNTYYGISIKSKISALLSLKEKKRIEFLINNIKNSYLTG